MDEIYVLKIRWSGEEDDVFLFHDEEDAHKAVIEYFELDEEWIDNSEYADAEDYLLHKEIGYFDITLTEVK